MSRSHFSKLLLVVSIMGLWESSNMCMAAPEISGPTEVGNTIMPPGNYSLRDEKTKKLYSLTVTTKGTMIVAPATASVEPLPSTTAAAASTTAIAPATAGGVDPGAVPGAPGKNDAINKLLNKGMQRGVKELMKHGGQKQIQNLLK